MARQEGRKEVVFDSLYANLLFQNAIIMLASFERKRLEKNCKFDLFLQENWVLITLLIIVYI